MNYSEQIYTAKERLRRAELCWEDMTGQRKEGLSVGLFGDFVVVDDGQDKWLASFDDLTDSTNTSIERILDGTWDHIADDDELMYLAYDRMFDDKMCIYTRQGNPSEVSAIAELEVDEQTRKQIIESLGIEEEYEEYLENRATEELEAK